MSKTSHDPAVVGQLAAKSDAICVALAALLNVFCAKMHKTRKTRRSALNGPINHLPNERVANARSRLLRRRRRRRCSYLRRFIVMYTHHAMAQYIIYISIHTHEDA